MQCPSCKAEVEANAWFCPICAEQLKSEPFDETADEPPGFAWDAPVDDNTFVDEVSETIAWSATPDFSQEALIVGAGFANAEEPGDVQVFDGAISKEDGTTSSFAIYADVKTAGLLKPEAIPVRTETTPGDFLTPYEAFVYAQVDGRRSIEEIQSSGLLAPPEVAVSLLTLLDRGSIAVGPAEPTPAPNKPPSLDPRLLVELAEPAPRTPTPTPMPPPVAPPPPPKRESVGPRPSATVVVTRRKVPETPAPAAPQPQRDPTKTGKRAIPIGSQEVHTDKAKELFTAAMKDRAQGNLVSARMNLKLAIAFDPGNEKYQEAFSQLANLASPTESAPKVQHAAAQKHYEDACAAEVVGEIDKAIRLLELGLRHGEEAVLLNRLGVILATKKRQFVRAQELLQRAVELAPSNPVYTHNLSKVLGLAAARDVERAASSAGVGAASAKKKKGGFWQRLFGRS